jgi:hypothetical protein
VIVEEIPSRNWPAGTNTSQPTAIALGINTLRATFTRESWPVGVGVITCRIEISFDGGATWPEFASTTWDGGDYVDRNGNLMTSCYIQRDVKEPQNGNRQVRATFTRTVGLRTGITVEAF